VVAQAPADPLRALAEDYVGRARALGMGAEPALTAVRQALDRVPAGVMEP